MANSQTTDAYNPTSQIYEFETETNMLSAMDYLPGAPHSSVNWTWFDEEGTGRWLLSIWFADLETFVIPYVALIYDLMWHEPEPEDPPVDPPEDPPEE
jgi:hypothetical protein